MHPSKHDFIQFLRTAQVRKNEVLNVILKLWKQWSKKERTIQMNGNFQIR